jgi:hypothetical protein
VQFDHRLETRCSKQLLTAGVGSASADSEAGMARRSSAGSQPDHGLAPRSASSSPPGYRNGHKPRQFRAARGNGQSVVGQCGPLPFWKPDQITTEPGVTIVEHDLQIGLLLFWLMCEQPAPSGPDIDHADAIIQPLTQLRANSSSR